MNQVIHNQIKKVSAVMAAVLLSLTLASCGGGGGGGSTSSNPLAPGGLQARATFWFRWWISTIAISCWVLPMPIARQMTR